MASGAVRTVALSGLPHPCPPTQGISAYDRWARDDDPPAAQFKPKVILNGWTPGPWYEVVLDFNWAAESATAHARLVDTDAPEAAHSTYLTSTLVTPTTPIHGIALSWGAGPGSVAWRALRVE